MNRKRLGWYLVEWMLLAAAIALVLIPLLLLGDEAGERSATPWNASLPRTPMSEEARVLRMGLLDSVVSLLASSPAITNVVLAWDASSNLVAGYFVYVNPGPAAMGSGFNDSVWATNTSAEFPRPVMPDGVAPKFGLRALGTNGAFSSLVMFPGAANTNPPVANLTVFVESATNFVSPVWQTEGTARATFVATNGNKTFRARLEIQKQ